VTTSAARLPKPLAICSGCGRERSCYFPGSDRPICHTCRWRGWQPPADCCTVCGRDRPCHHAGTGRAICRTCTALRPERHQPCVGCGQRRRVARRVGQHAECAACLRRRMTARVDCPGCGRTLRPAATDPARCERCPGEKPLPECRSCGTQPAASRMRAGRCPDCALRHQLAELRTSGNATATARLASYLDALAVSPSADGVLRWLERSQGAQTLRELATGALAITHEALDNVDRGQTTTHLRAALVQHGVLPARHEQAAALERATARALTRLPDGEDRAHVRAFATWQVHHHAQRMRAAVELALWADSRGLTLGTLQQHDLDQWLEHGASATQCIRDFLTWAARADLMAPLTVPRSQPHRHVDQQPTDERLATIRRLLHDDTLDLRDRVGGLLVLLFAQPISRVLALTVDDITTNAQRVTIRLGREPVELPAPLDELVLTLAGAPRGHATTAATTTRWLLPGMRLDAPLSHEHYRRRLSKIGIPTLPARTGALASLAAQMPPAIIADLLGLSESSAAHWCALAGGDWNSYAAHAAGRYTANT
jgi:hypothetical protein